MKIDDTVAGAILLVLSLAVLWSVQGYPKIPGQNVGPSAFPGLVAGILAGCSIALIVRGVRARAAQAGLPWFELLPWTRSPRHVLRFALAVGLLAAYVLCAETVGFLVCGTLMLAAMMLSLGVRVPMLLAIAPVATLVIHLIFYKGLRVPLPWGLVPILY